jgi:polyphosphate kinase
LAKAHQPAVFKAKFNSLTDKEMIDKIYQAIRLVSKSICWSGESAVSVRDCRARPITACDLHRRALLEHSRIYCFGQGDQEKVYIASADLMTRNTDKRVEIATPVFDKEIASRISRFWMSS